MSSELTGPAALPMLHLGSEAPASRRNKRLEEEVVALYDQFREPLLRYLSSFGLAPQDSEDAIQEVFLALFRHLSAGKPRNHLRAWLFRVAHNLALKQRLRDRREQSPQLRAPEDTTAEPGVGPEDQALQEQTRRRLLAVVAALTEQDRRCLFLRAEGLRYREIAAVLDMSLGAVSISLARSLGKMTKVAR